MSLILRGEKGSKLTIQEMDGNLSYLESLFATASNGLQGPFGHTGSNGLQGLTGLDGTQGIQGPTGYGIQGLIGLTGLDGPQGAIGYQGITGYGLQGLIGLTGLDGSQGAIGYQGITGPTGIQDEIFGELKVASGSSIFTLDNTYISGTVRVYINGVRIKNSDVTESDVGEITLGITPDIDDEIIFDYKY